MKKLLTKLLLTALPLLSISISANAAPTTLNNYSQVVNALKHGSIVRAIYTLIIANWLRQKPTAMQNLMTQPEISLV